MLATTRRLNSIHSIDKFGSNVVHLERQFVVVDKPNCILSQVDKVGIDNKNNRSRLSILEPLREYIKHVENREHVFLSVVHRLDYVTSGVMVVARTTKAASRLSEAIRDNNISKRYLCVVEGTVQLANGFCRHYLSNTRDLAQNSSTVVLPLVPYTFTNRIHEFDHEVNAPDGYYEAVMSYRLIGKFLNLQQSQHLSLLDVTLESGRKHQIRAQLGHIGHPVVGDVRYGSTSSSRTLAGIGIALHAYKLSFPHPITSTQVHFKQNPPEWWAQYFGSEYSSLLTMAHNCSTEQL